MPEPESATDESPVGRLLAAFGQYLVAERGVTKGTIAGYTAAVRPFLKQRIRGGRLELGKLEAADVTRFVLRVCRGQEVGSAKYVVTALRSLLGYGAGAIAPLLFGAILDWHGANTPGAWGWAFVSLGVAGLGAVLSAVLLYRTTEAQVLHRGAGHRPAPLAVSPR